MTFEDLHAARLAGDVGWWRLYDAAFAREEREPREVILAGVRGGAALAVRALDAGVTAGFAVVHLLRRPAALFLVYLAVQPELRGRGLGSELFRRTRTLAAERPGAAGPGGWVCEVTRPVPGASEAEQAGFHRLLEFYRKQGGEPLPHPYVQPPVDGAHCVPMQLIYAPPIGMAPPDTPGSEALIRAIYREKYQAVNGISDEWIAECWRRIEYAERGAP